MLASIFKSLLFSNTILLVTLALAAIAWIVAFVAQIAAESQDRRQGVLWFNIFLELFLILGIAVTIMTDSVATSRLQISAFLAVALVFAVEGIDDGIYTHTGSLDAVTAGYFILTIVNVIWLLFFTAEEDSTIYGILGGFGNGALSGPGGRISRGNGSGAMRNSSAMNGSGYTGGYPSNTIGGYQPTSTYGQGPSAADLSNDPHKANGMAAGPGSVRSAHTGQQVPSGAAAALPSSAFGKSEYSHHGSEGGRAPSPSSTNKHSAPGQEGGAGEPMAGYGYRARALYACESLSSVVLSACSNFTTSFADQANADDPTEISFGKGEILDIVDNSGKWWQARKPTGETGIVPSNVSQSWVELFAKQQLTHWFLLVHASLVGFSYHDTFTLLLDTCASVLLFSAWGL